MREFQAHITGPVGLSADEKHALVARILASPQFARAPQLKDFLRFIAERAITDEAAGIHEAEIGRRVLRRDQPDFDPNTDNIVRVQARHLRKKLEEYFSADGKDEPVLLTIPTGSYVPRFEPRAAPAATSTLAAESPARRPPLRTRVAIMTVLAAAFGGLAIWVAWRNRSASVGSTAAPASAAASDVLWARIARTGRKTYIVLSDSSLNVIQNLLRRQLSLTEYLAPGYPHDTISRLAGCSPAVLEEIAAFPRTSLNSAIVASGLQASARRHGVEAALRFPRDINIREFKAENFILIGSRFSIPWVELLEGQLNFTFGMSPKDLNVYIHDRSPQAAEQPVYRPVLWSGKPLIDYAAIALVPNLDGTGAIVLLQGVYAMATEAAAETISDPRTSPLHRILRSQAREELPHVEVLIRATGVAGAPAHAEVVATRIGVADRGGGRAQ